MSGSIKFILLFALFILGITNAKGAWSQESLAKVKASDSRVSANKEPEQASYALAISNGGYSHHPFYGESDEASCFDTCNAILMQSNFLNGANSVKILKNNSTIRSLRIIKAASLQEKNSISDPDNYTVKPTYRYYVYTLRHIII